MNSKWNRTNHGLERLEDKIYLDELEGFGTTKFYAGRHIIKKDMPIDKGVYLGSHRREAVVVDSEKYPLIKELYNQTIEEAIKIGNPTEKVILEAVYNIVNKTFTDKNGYDAIAIIRNASVSNDQKISLTNFIKKKTGTCRHLALTSGVLLELFKKDRYINGKISVDRNTIMGYGHAWARYTSNKGDVHIIDPMLLKRVEKLSDNFDWNYSRPEDRNNKLNLSEVITNYINSLGQSLKPVFGRLHNLFF